MVIHRWHIGKESACQCRRHKPPGFDPLIGKIPWCRKWHILAWEIPLSEKPGRLSPMVAKSQVQLSTRTYKLIIICTHTACSFFKSKTSMQCFFISFFSFIFISWKLITLQYCSAFCHTLT